ncbi:MAG TPA: hypothetical protein VGL61_12240 [Kofleriaceae bacterium]|jgi:hypothetical protein
MRFRDIALAVAYVLAFPLIWLRSLPGALRWTRLEVRAERDRCSALAVAEMRSAHRWTRDFVSMASGAETYELLEVELTGGRRIVRADYDGRIRDALAARGISKIMCTHLGKDVSVLAWLAWVTCVAPAAIVVLSWRACRS